MKEPAPRVLVVDDDPSIRRLATIVLASEGFDVETAADGEEALCFVAAAGDAPFAAIVTDLQMPRLDGWGLVSAVRSRGCSTPLILISAIDPGARGRAEADGFVAKPFDPEDLVNEVRRVLDGRESPTRSRRHTHHAGASAAG